MVAGEARRSPCKPRAPEGEGRFACNYVCLPGEKRGLPPPPVPLSFFPLTIARPVIPGSIKIPGGHDRSPSEIRPRLRPSSTSRRGSAYRRRGFFLLFRKVPLTTRLVRFRKQRRSLVALFQGQSLDPGNILARWLYLIYGGQARCNRRRKTRRRKKLDVTFNSIPPNRRCRCSGINRLTQRIFPCRETFLRIMITCVYTGWNKPFFPSRHVAKRFKKYVLIPQQF